MKILKYLVVALLVVLVTKKIQVQPPTHQLQRDLQTSLKEYSESSFNFHPFPTDTIILGSYNPDQKTGTVTFTDIVEHSQSVTPPNIANPKLMIIGTMKNQQYQSGSNLMGGQSATTTLYGIPHQSETPVKFIEKLEDQIKEDFKSIWNHHSHTFTLNIFPKNTQIIGSYKPAAKTATIIFNNVVEYSQPVTPPNLSNPKLIIFGSIKNPRYVPHNKSFVGGQSAIITLYGIAQTGEYESPLQNPTTKTSSQASSELVQYDPMAKTAIMRDGIEYVGVIEYNKAVTPPSISNPALKAFVTIPTPNYNPSNQQVMGGLKSSTTLYGIPVKGHKYSITNDSKTVIGSYWPESKIAQMNNGATYVEINETKHSNYRKEKNLPILLSRDQLNMLQQKYGLSNQANVNELTVFIGTYMNNHQIFFLHGTLLPATMPTLETGQPAKKLLTQINKTIVKSHLPSPQTAQQAGLSENSTNWMRNATAAAYLQLRNI